MANGLNTTMIDMGLNGQSISIQVDEGTAYTLTLSEDDTVQGVIDKINTDSGVTVSFNEETKQFSMEANNPGGSITLNGRIFI